MLEAGLAGARFFHLACAIILFGGTFFVLYSRLDVGQSRHLALLPAIFTTAALGALLSGLAWFVLTAANMSGAPVAALDRQTLVAVPWDTSFGLDQQLVFDRLTVAPDRHQLWPTTPFEIGVVRSDAGACSVQPVLACSGDCPIENCRRLEAFAGKAPSSG